MIRASLRTKMNTLCGLFLLYDDTKRAPYVSIVDLNVNKVLDTQNEIEEWVMSKFVRHRHDDRLVHALVNAIQFCSHDGDYKKSISLLSNMSRRRIMKRVKGYTGNMDKWVDELIGIDCNLVFAMYARPVSVSLT